VNENLLWKYAPHIFRKYAPLESQQKVHDQSH
jgi:hypothetical protein